MVASSPPRLIAYDETALRPGMVLHVRSYTAFGRAIRKVLSLRQGDKAWGNHDGLLVYVSGGWYVGDCEPVFAKFTPLEDYFRREKEGKCETRFLDVVGATPETRRKAVDYWTRKVNGSLYDFRAFPRLWFKNAVADIFPAATLGWHWAHWCTEGVADSWEKGAKMKVWNKVNPTPLTTQHRVGSTLVDVSDDVKIEGFV